MKYLLDTGPLTAYLLGRQGAVARLDALILGGEAATSSLVYAEAIEYFHSFPHFQQLQAELRGILHEQVKRLYPTYAVCEQYAMLRRAMRLSRTPTGQPAGLIGDMDTMIAATALAHSLTVITIDGDFARVPGLSHQILTLAQLRSL
jgi:predicted nucleic acid-binding protein